LFFPQSITITGSSLPEIAESDVYGKKEKNKAPRAVKTLFVDDLIDIIKPISYTPTDMHSQCKLLIQNRYSHSVFLLLTIFSIITLSYTETIVDETPPEISWPVDTSKKYTISSTFGESRMDHFHNGLDIAGKGIPIHPVARGRVIWKTDGRYKPGELPFGGGKTVILDHESYWSGYMHFDSIDPKIEQAETVDESQLLGRSGDTGHSGGAHLHFFIYEPETRRMHNPLLFLPVGFYNNNSAPVNKGYGIKLPEKFVQVKFNSSIRMSEDFPIYAIIQDSGTGRERWGVYELFAYNNNKRESPVQTVRFDYIYFGENHWLTSNGKLFDDLYLDNWINLGTGYKDANELIWVARGFRGPVGEEKVKLDLTD